MSVITMNTAKDRLSEAVKAAFLANMSHDELRIPLNAIIGFSYQVFGLGAVASAWVAYRGARLNSEKPDLPRSDLLPGTTSSG